MKLVYYVAASLDGYIATLDDAGVRRFDGPGTRENLRLVG
jgi:hypothetical protein